MKRIDVSVIIVNYNTKRLLGDCIKSVYDKTNDVSYEIIVVDNGSADGSERYIVQRYPSLCWINSGANIGFGGANNLGASQAKGKYLFFLNSDTLLENNAIKILYDYMEAFASEEHIGAIGSCLLDTQKNYNFSSGEFPSPQSEFRYIIHKLLKRNKGSGQTSDVDFITGADLFMTKEVFDSMQGFDPNIFMYYEETDLQYRMAKKGLKRRVIAGPEIIHLEGGSFKNKGLSFNRFLMAQNSYNYYVRKHYKGCEYFKFRLSLIIVRLLLFITTNWSMKEKLKAYKKVVTGDYTVLAK